MGREQTVPPGRDETEAKSLKARLPIRFRGLRAQIVLWTVLPLTLVLIGVAFTGAFGHEQAMRTLVEERDRALALVTAGQVKDKVQALAAPLRELASGTPFRDDDPIRQASILLEAGTLDGLLADRVALLDELGTPLQPDGELPAWTAGSGPVGTLARTVTVGQVPAIIFLPDGTGQSGLYLLGVPVYNAAGSMTGVLAGPVALVRMEFDGLLDQVRLGEHGVSYLVDGEGTVLAHSGLHHARDSLAGHAGLATALQDSNAGSTLCQAPDGERMTLAYAPVGVAGADWRVIIEQPWHEVVSPVLRFSQLMPLVAALAAVVALLTLYYGVQSIARPLQALGKRAEQVAWGNFEATAEPVGGVQEIEELRRTLDQMAQRIQSYQRGMHDYIAAITQGQEEERKRLSRELHDDTAQSLIALRQQVEMAQKIMAADPKKAAQRLADVQALLADTLEGVRRFSRDLRPTYLEDLGLVPALEMLARRGGGKAGEAAEAGLAVHLATSGTVRRLPADLELAAYRTVQEALNNVVQHAEAAEAWITVAFEPDALSLTVRDNGRGFEAPARPEALAQSGHFGLMGIQERALLFGGRVTLRSAPGQGTEVAVRLPYRPRDGSPSAGDSAQTKPTAEL